MLIYKEVIGSTFKEVNISVLDVIDALKTECDIIDTKMLFKINFVLREIMNNAVEHGNKFDEEKKITCEVFVENNVLSFEVEDEGEGIDLSSNPFSVDHDYILRERNRGMKVIEDLNFRIFVKVNKIRLELEL